MNYLATDVNGVVHNVQKLVICINDANTANVVNGGVYAVVGSNGSDYFILDHRNVKQNFRFDRFQDWHKNVWLNDTEGAVAVQADNGYKTITEGYYYPMLLRRADKKLEAGSMFVKDNKGIWGVFSKRAFTRDSLQYTAPALAYRAQLALNPNGQASASGASSVVGAPPIGGQAMSFKPNSVLEPQRLNTDVVNVKVRFKDGDEKTYSYKHLGSVNIGDYAVVVVENDRYPQLCGTKVVEVVDVLPMTDMCKATRWLVTVFNMNQYHARMDAEARFQEAKATLDAKVEEAKRLSVYKMLAQDNPEVASALAGLQELAKVLGTTL